MIKMKFILLHMKITAIQKAPIPSDSTQLKSFLGMINYYERFMKNLSSM